MQEIHTIGGGGGGAGGGGRLFAGGSGGGDRRLRPQHGQNQQSLKCPRCDSSNTKFCYYNNYNLSQPRHFCKSCRRYWTKGGVLRNVPVGGGCRKTKRSKPKQSVFPSDGVEVTAAATDRNSNSHSSSESSSLTVTTTAAINTATAGSSGEVASTMVNSSNTPTNLINFPDSRFFMPPQIDGTSVFNQQHRREETLMDPSGTSNGQIFTEIGSFTGLMTSSNEGNFLGFNMSDISTYRLQQEQEQDHHTAEGHNSNPTVGTTGKDEMKMEPINFGFLDQTDQLGLSGLEQSRTSNCGLTGIDWQINGGESDGGDGGGSDQNLFDFSGNADHSYWSHQWGDIDQSLNFPPLV